MKVACVVTLSLLLLATCASSAASGTPRYRQGSIHGHGFGPLYEPNKGSMPSKSKAQFAKMKQLHAAGKLTDKQLAMFNGSVDEADLPERVGSTRTREAAPVRHPLAFRKR